MPHGIRRSAEGSEDTCAIKGATHAGAFDTVDGLLGVALFLPAERTANSRVARNLQRGRERAGRSKLNGREAVRALQIILGIGVDRSFGRLPARAEARAE
jgi:hypothetical protein